MMGRTHLISGVAVGLATVGIAPAGFGAGAVWVSLVAVASMAPDLDHPSATLTLKLRYLGSLVCWAVTVLSRWAFRRVQGPADRGDGGHRHLTHTLVSGPAAGLVTVGVWALLPAGLPVGCWTAGLAVTIGWWTHIAGDAITKSGCPLLWPLEIRRRRWHRPRLPRPVLTGGVVERWLVRPALTLAAVLAGVAQF